MEGAAVENLIDFDMPSTTQATAPSAFGVPSGADFFSGELLMPEPANSAPVQLPEPIAPTLAGREKVEGADDSDATESADSENEATDSPSHHSESHRSSSSSSHSAEDPDVMERRQFMKAYVEKLFHSREDFDQEEKARFGELCSGENGKGRGWFAKYVSVQRCNSKCVSEQTFYRLVQSFAVVLFECYQMDDYSPAKHLMTMCFTYYYIEPDSPAEAKPKTPVSPPPSPEKKEGEKIYLYTHLKQQPIWHTLRFWNAAFFDAVHCERNKRSPTTRAAMQRGVLFVLLLTVASVWTAPTETDSGPVVNLKHGSLRGQYVTVTGSEKAVEQYLSIPFAQPPVGPLRLTAPKPAELWQGERDATQHPPVCLQDLDALVSGSKIMGVNLTRPAMSEDCLYLNVYTPSQRSATEKLPVMVWIYGGGLYLGGAILYDGSVLAAYENIVVVVIQYRLGIVGYFSTGDEHARGNWGFLDQIAALQWVQQNIENFGGDPQSVTIVGQSAGGMSADMLTVSPLAKGLFHRAIFQSGAATQAISATKPAMFFAKAIANVTECDPSSTELLVKCLREKSEEEIVQATKKAKIFLGSTVDGIFLPDVPENLLKSKNFQKVPVLIGVTNHEFGWILPLLFIPPGWDKGMDRKTVAAVLGHIIPEGVSGGNELIMDEYLKDAKTPEEIRNVFTDMMGDLVMVLPVLKTAAYHRDAGANVYMYEFQHRPSLFKDSRPSFVKSDHGDEVGFVFGLCFSNNQVQIIGTTTEEENQLCKTMMSYWGNFIRTGSPNGPGMVNWPLFDQSDTYLNLGLQQTEGKGLRQDKVHFFLVELPQKLSIKLAT